MGLVARELDTAMSTMALRENVNQIDGMGNCALMHARTPGIAKALIEAGADIKARDLAGRTALMLAAARGDVAVAHTLLVSLASPAAYINAVDNRGYTALMHAASERDNAAVITVLAHWGADLEARTTEFTALDGGSGESWQSHGGNTALLIAAKNGVEDALEALLQAGANSEAVNSSGCTGLMLAARHNQLLAVKCLCRADVDVEARNKDGLTALMLAAKHGNGATVAKLYDSGAALEAIDRTGATALFLAARENNSQTIWGVVSPRNKYQCC
jgi:ankyrin repeat protein